MSKRARREGEQVMMHVEVDAGAGPAAVPTAQAPAAAQSPAPAVLSVKSRVDLDGTRALTDPKHYRLVTFSNGLEALLITDPRCVAAASASGKRGVDRVWGTWDPKPWMFHTNNNMMACFLWLQRRRMASRGPGGSRS
jgi:hypothetical protein